MIHQKPIKLIIVIPVFNDWESFAILVKEIDKRFRSVLGQTVASISILGIDDGSTLLLDPRQIDFHGTCLESVDILHLAVNVGHQRAIIIALAFLEPQCAADAILIMDADGEDSPEDALRLVEASIKDPQKIILAARTKRSEGLAFRSGYMIYRLIYRLLCGSSIQSGNFCLIPASFLSRLVGLSDLWNHFAAGIMRSKLPMISVPTYRGVRFRGQSHMSLVNLLAHGLSAISVHLDLVAIRVLMGTGALVLMAIAGFIIVLLIKLFTTAAIPGWASTIGLSFLLIAIQGTLMSILLVFIVLNNRQQRMFIPHVDCKHYIKKLTRLYGI
jgi:glycosyltransferase involved in cell wall biosynthesis